MNTKSNALKTALIPALLALSLGSAMAAEATKPVSANPTATAATTTAPAAHRNARGARHQRG